jgi:hypothetical protein
LELLQHQLASKELETQSQETEKREREQAAALRLGRDGRRRRGAGKEEELPKHNEVKGTGQGEKGGRRRGEKKTADGDCSRVEWSGQEGGRGQSYAMVKRETHER